MTEQELAGTIWNIKEIIRGVYDDTEVENVILPFTLLRRLDCVLQDAWRDPAKDKVGCEFPFTRLFYRYTPLRTTDEILAELITLENDTTSTLQSLISDAK
ncbi:type I restriction-modification system subunit M N-terminal domain-containing protein [Lepagella muris]|jgi:hypothetical protein|uniref:Uncharacterized protein n=1 Tax=Lepagella muris TaxID=3032870 RepID=A0AC61RB01_9BACT|nr:type I restriction-modification system subunit M N-terminal domain-containing protein [Lepagella muris]ROT05391.1 hypothetical protein EEL33_12050 [Muribaculaceae bacterium Isolate-037 (Harlan)]TGY75964.1 hypothetical protein E5331_19135 [Lepagella muris]THG46419.1 hypothetical protein E5984_19045 [Bacteroidales bacterium]TKC58280.1 hypothetical protein E5359_010385 [Bacteroidales bacterium]